MRASLRSDPPGVFTMADPGVHDDRNTQDHETRTAALKLRGTGHAKRAIATALKISIKSVKAILESGSAEVPALERPEMLAPALETIRTLHLACKGNLVRVPGHSFDAGEKLTHLLVSTAPPPDPRGSRRRGAGEARQGGGERRRAQRVHPWTGLSTPLACEAGRCSSGRCQGQFLR